MGAYILTLSTSTPVMLGRWLTLDALLDGVLEREGVSADERVLPLDAVAPSGRRHALTAKAAYQAGLVFCASAMLPGGTRIVTGPGDVQDESLADILTFETGRPILRKKSIIGGARPTLDFQDEQYPFAGGSKKFETRRRETGAKMATRTTLDPGTVNWLFQGDADAVLKIIRRVTAIGAKVAAGNGAVVPGSAFVDEVDEFDPYFGLVNDAGDLLLRPVPSDLFPQFGALDVRRSLEGCWPPYWEKAIATPAFVPVSVFHDGLLSIL